jgi:uncharacterized protein YndB with AHSA1/START domain
VSARAEALSLAVDGAFAQSPPIRAVRELPHPPEDVFAFLADLDKHWRLTDRSLRLVDVAADRRMGRIAMRSPVGLRRIARTEVTTISPPRRFGGVAAVGRKTRARVMWDVAPHEEGARVELTATVLEASSPDALLLAVGGRRWLQSRFERVLERLAQGLAGD